jgi:ribonuclease R
VQAAPGGQERLLCDVLGLIRIAESRRCGAHHGRPVALDEFPERRKVLAPCAFDEGCVGHLACRRGHRIGGWEKSATAGPEKYTGVHAMLSADQLLARIRATVDHPASVAEIVRLLRIPREERPALRRQLKRLASAGALVETRGRLYGLPERMDLVVGRLSMARGGFGFVHAEPAREGLPQEVFVSGLHLNEAMHGDRVVARVERTRTGDRPEGRILRVLQRAQSTLVGRFDVDASGMRFVVPFDRRVAMDVVVPRGDERQAEPGEMVAVEITRWPTPSRGPVGRVVERLGTLDTPGVDVRIVLRKHAIPEAHGEAAEREARRLGSQVRPRDLGGRTDFRDRVVLTIDGEHARDFDDAVSIQRGGNGHFLLAVHIADVAHYVEEGSALDLEARDRGTSVYFPDRAVHMFPADLATGLCSLNPHVDRLVQSCVMDVDARGDVVRHDLHDGIIRSDARLTYTEVNAILADRDPDTRARHAALVPALETMHELFEVLRARRRRRGSIDFDLPEPEVHLDAQGLVDDIVASERNVAHRLIEEFMLLANETVAQHLEGLGFPAVYRVHERPDPVKVAEFDAFVSTLGDGLGASPDAVRPGHFQKLVERMHGRPEERAIASLMLRTMQKARYDVANLGHFGLAASSYTHFTSPIRRYPDLLVHRALRASRTVELDEDQRAERVDDLSEMARYASDREWRAEDAERELLQWKQVRFMAGKVGSDFEGYVTGVAPFGLFVELTDHFVEGLVHVASMSDDYYRFVEGAHQLRGEHTHRRYRLGDRVSVRVVRADLERRQVDLTLLGGQAPSHFARGSRIEARGPRRKSVRPGRREREAARRAPGHDDNPRRRRGR